MACRATDDPADEAEACSSEDADCAPRCDDRLALRRLLRRALGGGAGVGRVVLDRRGAGGGARVDDRQHRGGRGVGGVRRGGDGEVRRGQLRGERGLAGGRRLLVADQAVRGHAAGGRDGAEGGQRQPGGLRGPRERVGTGVRDRAAAVATVRRTGATVVGDDAHRAGRRVLGGTVTSCRTRGGGVRDLGEHSRHARSPSPAGRRSTDRGSWGRPRVRGRRAAGELRLDVGHPPRPGTSCAPGRPPDGESDGAAERAAGLMLSDHRNVTDP